ncbi:MAG: glycerophosphodiester phosphodiesterase [Acidimicrobiales bacterium]
MIASCGVHRDAPPNSIAAFEAAIGDGCDMTETDFRRSADGIIVFHDKEIDGRPVLGMTRQEIGVATGFLPPTLMDFVECCRGRIAVDCELKEDGLEEEMVEAVCAHFSPEQFLFTSFLPSVLERIRQLRRHVPTGLLSMRGLTEHFELHPEWEDRRSAAEILDTAREVGADYVLPDFRDTELLEAGASGGIDIIAWAARTEPEMRGLLGCSTLRGIITDRPDLLMQILRPDGPERR